MKKSYRIFAALLLAIPTLARADLVIIDTDRITCTINGIRAGKLSVTIDGTQKLFDLDNVAGLQLENFPKLADAESKRPDAKTSAALYKTLIPTINRPDLRLLVEWRAIDPTDKDFRWTEALAYFLDVYQSSPTDSIWNARPSHWPAPASAMLTEGADRVTAAIKTAPNDDARKNLRKLLLDIYTHAGNTQAAERIAREIETGIAVEAPPASPISPLAPVPVKPDLLAGINAALNAKNFASVITQADAQLPAATGEIAVQLLSLKAQALDAEQKPKEAAATLMRIFAHYPASAAAPTALLSAARLEKKLNDPAGAKILLSEIIQKYPDSKEAVLAAKE